MQPNFQSERKKQTRERKRARETKKVGTQSGTNSIGERERMSKHKGHEDNERNYNTPKKKTVSTIT